MDKNCIVSWSFESLLKHIDDRFVGSDKYNSVKIAELDKRINALLTEKSLRDEQRFIAQEKAISIAFTRSDDALSEAKNASVLGFQKSNEWQSTFRDLSLQYMPRSEFNSEFRVLTTTVANLSERLGKIEGSNAGVGQSWGVIVSIVSMLIAIVSVVVAIMLQHK